MNVSKKITDVPLILLVFVTLDLCLLIQPSPLKKYAI
jgi:hypothetical protein